MKNTPLLPKHIKRSAPGTIHLLLLFLLFSFTHTVTGIAVNLHKNVLADDSLDIKIGQMILMGLNDRKELMENDSLVSELRTGKLGGIILFEKNISPVDSKNTLMRLISDIKKNAPSRLFISIDEEGGKVHRLKGKYGFVNMPSAAYLGKLNNPDSTYLYNERLASQLSELGINLNFAPVVDLAVNPENKVIVKTNRSFSADDAVVTRHALICIKAHHAYGIMTILKHFPGHGSSTADSHLGIVDVSSTWNSTELFPYRNILLSGTCDAVMTAHIINRSWDSAMLPATLSAKVVNGILRKEMGYNSVVFSDDMQMNAISKNYGFEKSIELAINAGVDVLMFGNNVHPDERPATATEVHAIIKKLVEEGKISKDRIDEAFTRIINLKSKRYETTAR